MPSVVSDFTYYRFITKLFHLAIVLNLFSKEKIGTFYRFKIKASKENSIFVQLSTVWLFFYKMRSKTVTIATFTDIENVGVWVSKPIT